MKTVKEGDSRVISIIGRKKADLSRDYRLNTYSYCLSENGHHLIKSTMTGEIAELTDLEWSLLDPAVNPSVPGSVIADNGLERLLENCMFVYKDEDDYERYALAVKLLKSLDKKKGVRTYTILPTTGCNARCVYCYEEGMKAVNMSEDTADRVVEFILKTKREKEITLQWFGGEPLLGRKIITRICKALASKGVSYKSRIITNAALITSELMDEAVECWHLKEAQVSVDGSRCDYESRKLFADPEKHNYDTLMNSIGLLLDRGIKVTLRSNYDQGNIDGMYSFWEEVHNRFGSAENLSIYPAMLFQAQENEDCVELDKRMVELKAKAVENGFVSLEKSEKTFKMKTNYCMADSEGNSVVISPEGDLYHCEHLPGNTSFGSVFDETFTITSDKRAYMPVDPKCRNCRFLPECTTFYRNGCPDCFDFCDKLKDAETSFNLKKLAL